MLRLTAWALLAALLGGVPGAAASLTGDFDGDGSVGPSDRGLLPGLFGAVRGDPKYDPAADLDGDGSIDRSDVTLLVAQLGNTDAPDTTPPGLFVTLNAIPDAMNDVLVVPPDGFQITVAIDSLGGSLIDTASLSITSRRDIGPHPAGTELAPLFQVTPLGAVWEIPAGSDLERTTHELTVRVRDLAGNEAEQSYRFAVRDFTAGPPLGNLQTVFVDFDQDRNLGPEVDFLESLREFGLTSPTLADSGDERALRDHLVAAILRRAHRIYGRNPDGSTAADSVNVVFQATRPPGPHSRICVGGESPQSAASLGAASMDENNLVENDDECASAALFGVFPHAIDELWGTQPGYRRAFGGVDPDLGGVPFGEGPLDASLLEPGFDPTTASPAQAQRFFSVLDAYDAFAAIVSVALAHEVGHMLGLVAHGPAPGGLWGGSYGASTDHNLSVRGGVPTGNFVMNAGNQFSFDEITGRGGESEPVFRPLAWAYLRDRIALDYDVTELLPPLALSSVTPEVLVFSASSPELQSITLRGEHIAAPGTLELVDPGRPVPLPTFGTEVVTPRTLTTAIHRSFVAPGLYDLRVISGDGQVSILEQALRIRFE